MTSGYTIVMPPEVVHIPPEALPNYDEIATEDDTPVDNIFSERQMRLLTEPLYSSWAGPGKERPFLALANVGLFYQLRQPAIVPDVMLSMDVQAPEDVWAKEGRSYFIWEYGKPPDVVIEIVSNTEGEEAGRKMALYARIRATYYAIYDPETQIQSTPLRLFVLRDGAYHPLEGGWMAEVSLGLTLWEGTFEGIAETWLRWCDQQGTLIPTGAERAEQEAQRAEQERQRADTAEQELVRLRARLRELGIETTEG